MILLIASAQATTWTIGPGQIYTLPSQVSSLVDDGDTVNIEAGVYPSDVALWQANGLVLRGVGGMAHLESNGMSYGGKAIWVIAGNSITVEWIEFSECTVPDQNGAGIRQEGLNLTVRHCYFHDNENGILAGEVHPSTIRIEHSEFGHNGFGDGYSHNLYIGNIDSLIFRFNYSHHAHVGHELKSRAWVNVIEYNRFSNEADGDASREMDLPNGGQAYIIGNVIQQGPLGENSNMVGYGLEGLSNPGPHEFYAINNTLVNEKTVGTYVHTPASGLLFKAYGNILAGGGSFMAAWPSAVDTLANVRFTNIASAQFVNAANYDYRIDESSPAHNAGYPAGLANSGYPLVAWYEYVHPTEGVLRCQHALLDAGAFETCTTAIDDRTTGNAFPVWPNPTSGLLNIASDGAGRALGTRLLDMQGRVLDVPMQRQGDHTVLDLGSLPAGIYMVIVSGQRTSWVRRVIKD
jgi:hypothetical protein